MCWTGSMKIGSLLVNMKLSTDMSVSALPTSTNKPPEIHSLLPNSLMGLAI
jgi:hypothetical protein